MGLKILFDQWGGLIRSIETAPGNDGELIVTDEQEASAILRANSRDADIDQTGNHFRLVARVPMAVVKLAQREGWADDMQKWKAFLNDPDNRAFRIWPGRL
jgi:hypothetical protein